MNLDPHGHCAECGSPLARGQRYCLACGARLGARSPQLEQLLRRMRDPQPVAGRSPAGDTLSSPEPPPGDAGAATSTGVPPPALRLPPARISALLVLVFLGFGVIIGGAAASRVESTLAASSRRGVRVLLPPSPSPSPSAESSSPPGSEAEATPEASSAAEESGGAEESGAGGAGGGSSNASARSPGAPSGSSNNEGSSGGGSSGGKGGGGSAKGKEFKLNEIKHVFVVMLDDQPYAAVFGPGSAAHYLSGTLEHKGALLVRYYAVAHEQLADGIALLSGQGPTPQTAQNCPIYGDLVPATAGAQEQVSGQGCVYPSATQTLPGQLSAKHLTWKAYVAGLDEGPGSEPTCAHPTAGATDPNAGVTPPAGGRYASWSNPFVYFHALTDPPTCASRDVGLGALQGDLSNTKGTPSLSYVVPNRCEDGNPLACAPGAGAGMGPADSFLQRVVPEILASKAYKEGGLLAITVDQAPSSGEFADSSSCCGQPRFPNVAPSTSGLAPEGGGQVGALLISPFIKGGTVSQEPYNHFSLLRTIEDAFGLSHLGYAAAAKVTAFEASLFSNPG